MFLAGSQCLLEMTVAHDEACMMSPGISQKLLARRAPEGAEVDKRFTGSDDLTESKATASETSESTKGPPKPKALARADTADVHRYLHFSACPPISAARGRTSCRVHAPIPIGEASEAETCVPRGIFMRDVQRGSVLATHQSSNLMDLHGGLTLGSFRDLKA